MSASWHDHADSPVPSRSSTGDTSTRDAGDAGSPPPASSESRPEQADPSLPGSSEAASRTPLPLEVERALRLVDELASLGLGSIQIGFLWLDRATFDAIPGDITWHAKDGSYEYWTCRVVRPVNPLGDVTFFCKQPPVESEAA